MCVLLSLCYACNVATIDMNGMYPAIRNELLQRKMFSFEEKSNFFSDLVCVDLHKTSFLVGKKIQLFAAIKPGIGLRNHP